MRHFDHAQVVAECICPRPMLVVAPTLDIDMLHAGVEQLKADVLQSYIDAGVANGKDTHIASLH